MTTTTIIITTEYTDRPIRVVFYAELLLFY